MYTRPPDCIWCRRFRKAGELWCCEAFPSGIPRAILASKHDHRLAFDGDNGLTFQPIDDFQPDDSVFYKPPK